VAAPVAAPKSKGLFGDEDDILAAGFSKSNRSIFDDSPTSLPKPAEQKSQAVKKASSLFGDDGGDDPLFGSSSVKKAASTKKSLFDD
jgi:hypothetical protein